jgi:NitT/TauT family transport system permease protein
MFVVLTIIAIATGVVALAARWSAPLTPSVEIDLSWRALPVYTAYSTLRMAIAYVLSLVFSLVYARAAAGRRAAEAIMLPVLDILQSIPILSFMPGIVLGLVALFPDRNIGLELAAIILIFTSQAWNIAFGFHQSLVTIPREMREAAALYRLNPWEKFSRVELPFGVIPLVWNSMMSWAGGWFFLIAAEQFTLGDKDFRLPGLGSYLKEAADASDYGALAGGLVALVVVIVLLDLCLWRPLVAWSDRFKTEQTESSVVPRSVVLDAIRRSALIDWVWSRFLTPVGRAVDQVLSRLGRRSGSATGTTRDAADGSGLQWTRISELALVVVLLAAVLAGAVAGAHLLASVGPSDWATIGVGTVATLLRTVAALLVGVAWTVPVGVAIGLNPRLAQRFQPIVQVVASIPATALFPALLLVLIDLPGGLSLAAVALMLLGTQWYILFNVIAGATAIPSDLKEAAEIFKLGRRQRWQVVILPAIFPSLVTGMITATGGAWNASIVSEYVTFGGRTVSTVGLGAVIAGAADAANFPLLLAGTLTMALVVVLANRLGWRRLYRLAEQRFRLE